MTLLGNFAAAFLSPEPPLSWGQNGLLLFQPRISPTIRGFEEEDGGRNLTLSMLEWRRGGEVEEGAYLEGNLLRTCLVSQIPKLRDCFIPGGVKMYNFTHFNMKMANYQEDIYDLIKILMKMKMLMPAVMVGSRWCYTREGE